MVHGTAPTHARVPGPSPLPGGDVQGGRERCRACLWGPGPRGATDLPGSILQALWGGDGWGAFVQEFSGGTRVSCRRDGGHCRLGNGDRVGGARGDFWRVQGFDELRLQVFRTVDDDDEELQLWGKGGFTGGQQEGRGERNGNNVRSKCEEEGEEGGWCWEIPPRGQQGCDPGSAEPAAVSHSVPNLLTENKSLEEEGSAGPGKRASVIRPTGFFPVCSASPALSPQLNLTSRVVGVSRLGRLRAEPGSLGAWRAPGVRSHACRVHDASLQILGAQEVPMTFVCPGKEPPLV